MSMFSGFVLASGIDTAEPVVSRETRYGVNLADPRALLHTGPANLLLFGDSISSHQSLARLPTGIALEWKPPNGFSGWYVSTLMSSSGPLTNYAGTKSEAYSWPFCGFSYSTVLGIAGFTVTDYIDANGYASTNIFASQPSPLPKSLRVASKSGSAWNFPVFHGTYMGGQGTCQTGTVWASGDWITGKASNAIRIGVVHLANSATVTASMKLFTQEGYGSSTASNGPTATANLSPTNPATPVVEILWSSLASTAVNTPFGTSTTAPGLTANPVFMQYEGIGSTVPGTVMNGTYLAAAGNADWTGCWAITTTYDANSTPAGTNWAQYGVIIEDTTNTTGLYVDNISNSGDTIRTQIDGATAQQMANALALNPQRPINWILMQIGENHTAEEWDSGAIDEAQIRTDILARIKRCNDGWDTAGLPRGLITLVSPWETVGGTKSGSAWYTTLADIYRDIARSNQQVSFIDLRQMMADRFSADEMYNASRNSHMNILADGVHPSLKGERVRSRLLWGAIMGSIA